MSTTIKAAKPVNNINKNVTASAVSVSGPKANIVPTVTQVTESLDNKKGLDMKVQFSSLIKLEELRTVTMPVRVNAAGSLILLKVAKDEEGNKVPSAPENSIFGGGEYVKVKFGDTWVVVKSIILSDYRTELVSQIDLTSGNTRIHEYFAVSGVDNTIISVCKYGKNAKKGTVLSTLKKDATSFIVENVLNPGTDGIAIWTPWCSSVHHADDQIGWGMKSARKVWKLVKKAAKRQGLKIDEVLDEAVLRMPWLMNDALLFVNRQPVHDSECIQELRMVVTDSPFAAPSVTPDLMKAEGGDEDGDAPAVFTGRMKASVAGFLAKVMENFENRADCGPLKVYGMDYTTGTSEGSKGGKVVDVSLENVTYSKGNVWDDFLGFQVKGIVGLLATAIWQYAWGFARLLTTEELIGFAHDCIARDTASILTEGDVVEVSRLKQKIAKTNSLLTSIRFSSTSNKGERIARLALEITYRVFRDMFEHVFDARKGGELSYDPIDNLKALSRTGRFDWVGMEKAGIWVAPLKEVARRSWIMSTNAEGKESPKYSIREIIEKHDPIYFNFVSDRARGWKKDSEAALRLIDTFTKEGLDPIVKSLYLENGFIHNPIIEVSSKRVTPDEKGEIYNMLADARMGRVFKVGPSNMKEMIDFLDSYGIPITIESDERTKSMNLVYKGIKGFLPTIKVSQNVKGFDGKVSPYPGHLVKVGTTLRACPPMLIHDGVNPFMRTTDDIVYDGWGSKFPGVDAEKFQILPFHGILAHIILGIGFQELTPKEFVKKCTAEIRRFLQELEWVRNEASSKVFTDMVTFSMREANLSPDWCSLIKERVAVALYEAGFSLYAVSKNEPMSKFLYNDPDLGVPRAVAAYDVFWPLRTERRYDREALSTLRNLREFEVPSFSNVSSTHGLEMSNLKYRAMVTMAFFNTEANKHGVDPVDFTPSGIKKSVSCDITWAWKTLRDKEIFMSELDEKDTKEVNKLVKEQERLGLPVISEVRIDDDIMVEMHKLPVEWGREDMEGVTFKANFPGTKSMVKPMGRQLVASYAPIKTFNGFQSRLKATQEGLEGKTFESFQEEVEAAIALSKSQVILIDGVMPADSIVSKGAWSLIAEAAASRISEGFVLETNDPQEIVDTVIPAISAKLEGEGKPGDGKMLIYYVTEDSIHPVMGPDGKTLRAVVGDIPMYRIPFEGAFSGKMTKYRQGGIEKLGHIERGLIGEGPEMTKAQREEFAVRMYNLSKAVEAYDEGTVEESSFILAEFEEF